MNRKIVPVLIAASLVTTPLSAQVCGTLGDCLQELALRRVSPRVSEVLSELVAEENPGESAEIPGAATTVNDFLSRLRISADSGSLGDGDEEGLVLELNDFLGLPVQDGYKLQALMRKPTLFEKLAEQIPEDVRASRVTELEKGLNDMDNVSLVFTYSPMWSGMGRKPSGYAEEQSALLEAAADRIGNLTDAVFATQFDLGELIQNLPDKAQQAIADQNLQDPAKLDLNTLDPAVAQQVRQSLEAAISASVVRDTALLAELQAVRFFSFADLVANQPQLYVNGDWSSPNELVGPRTVTGKLTYEHGFINVNSLRRQCPQGDPQQGETDDQRSLRQAAFLTCFQGYLTPQRMAHIERGDRVAVSFEYSDVEDYEVVLPDTDADPANDVSLVLPADRKLVGSVALGRYLTFFKDGAGRSRFDFEWKYENFGDDPNRKDRSILKATFSQQVAEQAVFTLGVVYANRPELRGTVDEEISARLGLNYRLLRKGEI